MGISPDGYTLDSDCDSISAKLCTPYMPCLQSPESPESSAAEPGAESSASGLRDKKNVAGAAVRGSRDWDGGSNGGLRGKADISGEDRMVGHGSSFEQSVQM